MVPVNCMRVRALIDKMQQKTKCTRIYHTFLQLGLSMGLHGGERARYHSLYSDSLRAGRSGDRVPVGARYSAPVRTGPRAHPVSYKMGTGSFPGVKRPGRGVDCPSHLALRLKKQ
jgi:hypothetical protein